MELTEVREVDRADDAVVAVVTVGADAREVDRRLPDGLVPVAAVDSRSKAESKIGVRAEVAQTTTLADRRAWLA